jgi:hypothetical protein
MKRADLSPSDSVDGWQAIDATPQEKLDGMNYRDVSDNEFSRQYESFTVIDGELAYYFEICIFLWYILGAYYAGPCPVEAIRQGKTYLPFDCALFFAEINAKLRCWTLNDRTSEAVEAKFIQNDRYVCTTVS